MVISTFNPMTRKQTVITLIFIAILTAVMGEFKFFPIESSSFRIGLGSVTFFLLILFFNVRVFYAGIVTAAFLIVFRTTIDAILLDDALLTIFIHNIPASLFYLIFSLGLDQIRLHKIKEFPIQLWILGAFFEIIANTIEEALYFLLNKDLFFTWQHLLFLIFIACLRSFFVVGIYNLFLIAEQRRKIHEIIDLQSHLYTESLYMQQTMQDVESLTAESFSLYSQLKKEEHNLAMEALRISSEMHEVKKNTQRVVASLSNMMNNQWIAPFSVHHLLKYVVNTQTQYAQYLNKAIQIHLKGDSHYHSKQYLALLSILNNIVANAVEAIKEDGQIYITVNETADSLSFTITNNGPLINTEDIEVLFDPGFTTKYDSKGNPSTGIGLYHVKTIVESLGGTISIHNEMTTTFIVQLDKQFL